MLTIFVTVAVIVLSCLYWYRRDSRLPPGPKGFPLLGVIPYLEGHSARKFREWSKTYGSVYSVRAGQHDYVVLTEQDVIFEVLVKQGSKVNERPPLFIFDKCSGGYGILFASPRVWMVHRPFLANALRRLGMGKKILETKIIDEAQWLVEAISEKGGEAFDPKNLFLLAVVNVAASITLGERFAYDDKQFNEIVYRLVRGWQEDGKWVILMGYCSYLRHFPKFKDILSKFIEDTNYLRGKFKKFVDDHKLTYDKNEIRDVIDAFIEETKKEKHDSTFNDDQLVMLIRDSLDAGAQTTTCTMLWLMVALVRYPEYQKKIKEEVDKVVAEHETLTASHREKMPQTVAFIDEVMRLCPMAAQSHVHTSGEVTVKGYKIPKGTPIFAVIWSVHRDPKYFEDPEEFRPERFIDKETGGFVKSRYCNPFSLGKRACAGEQIARLELFEFMVGVIRRFEIHADDFSKIPTFEDGQYGIVYVPPRFKLKFIERS